jgi:beta-phosphoglucomutase-like phosphatase (HAD superfamily)
MSHVHDTVFLFDVDNTLLDNDAVKDDLKERVLEKFGQEACDRFWAIYEEEREKHIYADFINTLERFRLEHMYNPEALQLALWLMYYPFADRLYPDALAVVRHVSQWGLPVILTDGDGVFQPYKLKRSGLWDAFDGRVLGYIHKDKDLDAVERAYPAKRYILVDDKLKVLNAVKRIWGGHVTTVFVKQGHYANDPKTLASQPAADMMAERIAELMMHDFSAIRAN